MAANPRMWAAAATLARAAWRNREMVAAVAESLADKHKAADHARTLSDGRISHEYLQGTKHWVVWSGDTPVRAYPAAGPQTQANLATVLKDSRPGNRKRPDELAAARAKQAAREGVRRGATALRDAAKGSGPGAQTAARRSAGAAREAARKSAEAAQQGYASARESARSAIDRQRQAHEDHDAAPPT